MDTLDLYLVCRGHGKSGGILTAQGEREMERVAVILTQLKVKRENTFIFTSPTDEEIESAKIIAAKCMLDIPEIIEWLGKVNIMGYLIMYGLPKKPGIEKLIIVTEKNTLEKILPNFSYSAFNVSSGNLFKIILPDNKVERLI